MRAEPYVLPRLSASTVIAVALQAMIAYRSQYCLFTHESTPYSNPLVHDPSGTESAEEKSSASHRFSDGRSERRRWVHIIFTNSNHSFASFSSPSGSSLRYSRGRESINLKERTDLREARSCHFHIPAHCSISLTLFKGFSFCSRLATC